MLHDGRLGAGPGGVLQELHVRGILGRLDLQRAGMSVKWYCLDLNTTESSRVVSHLRVCLFDGGGDGAESERDTERKWQQKGERQGERPRSRGVAHLVFTCMFHCCNNLSANAHGP